MRDEKRIDHRVSNDNNTANIINLGQWLTAKIGSMTSDTHIDFRDNLRAERTRAVVQTPSCFSSQVASSNAYKLCECMLNP